MPQLALGTAQFGLDYGASNTSGKVTFAQAQAMVKLAQISGIDMLDTAAAYGNAEERLGQMNLDEMQVITKISAIPKDMLNPTAAVYAAVKAGHNRVDCGSLYGVLLHSADDLLVGSPARATQIYAGLENAKKDSLTKRIGVSVYTPQEALDLVMRYPIDLIQLPFCPIDARWSQNNVFDRLQEAGVEVHVRSIFLQGVLLQEPELRAPYFDRWSGFWSIWDEWSGLTTKTRLQACLGLAFATKGIDRIVVGAQSVTELEEIRNAAARAQPCTLPKGALQDDVDLLNPVNWSFA